MTRSCISMMLVLLIGTDLWGVEIRETATIPMTNSMVISAAIAPSNTPSLDPVLTSNEAIRLETATREMDQGNYESAIAQLNTLIEDKPSMLKAWELLGWAYWKSGQKEQAFKLWKDLARLDPRLPQALNLLGMACVAEGREDEAITYYQKSLELDGSQYLPRFTLARLYRWRGRLNDSIALLRKLQKEEPGQFDLRLELARALLSNWAFEEALPLWAEILKSDPQNQEYRASYATALLHNNRVGEAVQAAQDLISESPTNTAALTVLADAAEYGDHPEEAVPFLQRILDVPANSGGRQAVRTRLVRLLVQLYEKNPYEHPLEKPIGLARDMVDDDPVNVDIRLMLAELQTMNRQFDDAERNFVAVLRELNRHNQRAHRGLFELYLARQDYDNAVRELELIRAFNPKDTYYLYRLARLEAGRGRYRQAYQALDRMEEAGRRGAVPVLLYHGLTTSDWTPVMSTHRLRSHLLALKKAGYRFITPNRLDDYFSSCRPLPEYKDQFEPERVVMITFDDARRDSLILGTDIAKEMNAVFAMHIPVGNILRGDAFIADWDSLRRYRETGRWVYGSHLMYASDILPLDESGVMGRPLANRLWLAKECRLESESEYADRIKDEYKTSRNLLAKNLGQPETLVFMAYPMGDVGQETRSDVPEAVAINLEEAGLNYDIGFIQSPFGYAVNGDNPLLYQRHEMKSTDDGSNVIAQVMENHPVFLARRLRAEFAALQGKAHLALRTLDELKAGGYPEASVQKTATYVRDRVAARFSVPTDEANVKKGHLQLALDHPYVGARGEYFRDNLTARNVRVMGYAGVDVTPRLTLEAEGGFGRLQQDGVVTSSVPASVTNSLGTTTNQYRFNERDAGLQAGYVFTERCMLYGELLQRTFDSPADRSELAGSIGGQVRPLLHLDMMARYEHDVVPSAVAVVNGVTYDLGGMEGVWHVTDWWDLQGSFFQYQFSDENDRRHINAESSFLVWEPIGLYLGARYGYTSASEPRDYYWTPYELNRYYVTAALRRNVLNIYYNLQARIGSGRESVRAESEQQYQTQIQRYRDLIARGHRESWPAKDINAIQTLLDDLLNDPPEAEWKPVVTLSASTKMDLGRHWTLEGEVSYNRVPEYNETRVTAGIKYAF